MKKIIAAIIIGFAIFMAVAPAVAAPNIGLGSQGMTQNIAGKAGYDTSGDKYALSRTVGGIIRAVISMVGVVFLVLIVYAGVLWGTAAGNEEKVTQAKNILKSSLIGLVIVASAYGITALVFNFIIGAQAPSTNVGNYNLPESKMGCCYWEKEKKCIQTASQANCKSKWADAQWYNGESCTPYFNCSGGIEFN